MSLAERKAEEIKRRSEEAQLSRQWALKVSLETEKHAPALWERLIESLKQEVVTFAALVSSAKGLTAISMGNTHLLINKEAFPIVKANIYKTADGQVSVDLLYIKSGFGPNIQSKTKYFRFTVDEQLAPCFEGSDGRQYTSELLAEEILEPIFSRLS